MGGKASSTTGAVIWMVLGLIVMGPVHADWIDPDTPLDARSTQPFTAKPPPVPRASSSDSEKKHHKKKKHNRTEANENKTFSQLPSDAPTDSPSEAPSDAPTEEPPSESPTMYPTATEGSFELVFSDEFNLPGRTFEDGSDPRWTALDKNDYTNDALHYYAASNAVTDQEGNLVITTEAKDTDVIGFDDVKRKKTHVTKHFRSAMLQTWNKFCFTGGIIEAKVQLPGKSDVGGLWPAFWLLGNLARHTYVGSSEHIWPWSSNNCTDLSFAAQHITACDKVQHYGLEAGVGRGSPEIDIFEVQPGDIKANQGAFLQSPVGQPFMSASFQVAPGRSAMRPGNGWWPGPGQWYEGLTPGKNSSLNIGFYGNYNFFRSDPHPEKSSYWSDAISFNRQLDESFFNSSHVYRLEWDVPTDTKDGYLHWFVDGDLVVAMNGTGIRNGGTGSEISTEPSYILLNTAVSSQWGFPTECPAGCVCKDDGSDSKMDYSALYDCNSNDYSKKCGFSEGFCDMVTHKSPQYKVDYIRVYQNPNLDEQKVGCSTPERPTRKYIEAHQKVYKTENDERPLKPVATGRGTCDPQGSDKVEASCGGLQRGRCTQGRVCECSMGWTGPHCLASVAFDEIVWDESDSIMDVGFVPPQLLPRGLLVGLILLVSVFITTVQWKKRVEGWRPIPEVDSKYKI